jgi:molybdopterin-containing oxidoreductase family membrane subunit
MSVVDVPERESLAGPRIADPQVDPGARAPLVLGGKRLGDVTRVVSDIVEDRTPRWWWPAFLFSALWAGVGVAMIGYLVVTGVGVWGLNQPVGWAWDITNFVFWVGIGHAGTLISAILFLLRQRWRTSINRAAEAMTLFAVMCAGIFPAIHVGRIWRIYFVFPIPNHLDIWPNFRSPLLWDVFAVSTYATVSLLFWYVGLIPDLATLRDRAKTRLKHILYGLFALGWRGGQRHWRNYEMCYLILAGLSTPLVLSVHTIVSFDFAVSQVPGWHTTIFPPYFVAGAIFSGFAMVITLLVPARALFGLHDLITPRHLENMCKVLLATGLMVAYAYGVEFFTAWYSGNPFESFVFLNNRLKGPYAWAYWTMVTCNVLSPQLFWFKWFRRKPAAMFAVCIVVNIGMWFERFVIISTSLHRDALPSSWGYFTPTWVEILTFVGSFGIFLTMFLLFIRFLPMVAMSEVKGVMEPDTNGLPDSAEHQSQLSTHHSSLITHHSPSQHPAAGVIAEFRGPHDLLSAAKQVRRAGYRAFEVYSPYPIHGMDEAMGLGRSKLGWIVIIAGAAGAAGAYGLQYYTSVMDYPLITAGKPYNSWQAFLPVIFELGVLLASFAAVLGMLALNGLPRWYHPVLKHAPFVRASDDGFFLTVDASDARFNINETAELLERAGGRNVAPLEA